MAIFARIHDGIVAELVEVCDDITQRFHPALRFVEVTAKDVAVGWHLTETGFEAPPAAQG